MSKVGLVIARLDKLSRNEDVQEKLKIPDCQWDLIICDEAHKLSAAFFGGEIKYTKRYKLGQLLGTLTRHFLLLTATPHNGKEEDFQLFLALLDGDRFEGRFRDGVHQVDVSDLMRRMVKESLFKFDSTPLFPERIAYTVPYRLSDVEAKLYKEVTEYVREEFNRAEAEKRIEHLYPKAKLPDGREATVIAWLWARTVASPNPAFSGIHVPLISSFWLSQKSGKQAWLEPVVEGKNYHFGVRTGTPKDKTRIAAGTKLGRGANFRCILSDSPVSPGYIRNEAQAGRMRVRLMGIVAEGNGGRVYLPPNEAHESITQNITLKWKPDEKVTTPCHDVDRLPMYGMFTWGDAFTPRQLLALTTFVDLVSEARKKVRINALDAGISADSIPLRNGGTGSDAYAEAISVYLAFAISKVANLGSSITSWMSDRGAFRETFSRQAIPMVWDYAEANTFSESGGSISTIFEKISKVIEIFPSNLKGYATQADAASVIDETKRFISTDPPYYDNIGYADLSDFFYVWMRRSLQSIYPELFSTVLVPKAEEFGGDTLSPWKQRSCRKVFFEWNDQSDKCYGRANPPSFSRHNILRF